MYKNRALLLSGFISIILFATTTPKAKQGSRLYLPGHFFHDDTVLLCSYRELL